MGSERVEAALVEHVIELAGFQATACCQPGASNMQVLSPKYVCGNLTSRLYDANYACRTLPRWVSSRGQPIYSTRTKVSANPAPT